MKKQMKLFFYSVSTLLVMLTACPPPTIKTTALFPARFHEASKLKEIAVLPFDGPRGSEFTGEIEAILAGINIGDKQYFTLVDRTTLEKVISEMKFSQSELADPATAAKIGKLVGAKGIYTGVVKAPSVTEDRYKESRTRCASWVGNRCAQWQQYYVSCIKRVATFSFVPKLIEVETGRIIYANNISRTATSSGCEDSRMPKEGSELLGEAKQAAMEDFRRDVAPYYATIEIRLMDSTEGITSKEAENKFKQGIEYAKGNRFDRACELWGEVKVLSPNSPSVLYNLGICSEVSGQLEQALELYKQADRALGKVDDRITSALHRVKEAIEKQKKLQEQLAK